MVGVLNLGSTAWYVKYTIAIAFGPGTTLGFVEAPSNTSGTLTVSDGTHTAAILLLGQYLAANFTKQSDGNGGTLITDPPVSTNDQQSLISHPHA